MNGAQREDLSYRISLDTAARSKPYSLYVRLLCMIIECVGTSE